MSDKFGVILTDVGGVLGGVGGWKDKMASWAVNDAGRSQIRTRME